MREVDVAWAAGFIDADGSISMNRTIRGQNRDRRNYGPRVTAANRDRKPLDKLVSLFGGYIYLQPKPAHPLGWGVCADLWAWNTRRPEVVPTLEELLPHLVIKAAQAETMLEYFETAPNKRPRDRVSEAEEQRRDLYWRRLRLLNSKERYLKKERQRDG